MLIKPSRNFEGSLDNKATWLEHVVNLDWSDAKTRDSMYSSFFKASDLGLEKKAIVKSLCDWLRDNQLLDVNRRSFMGHATMAYLIRANAKARIAAKGAL